MRINYNVSAMIANNSLKNNDDLLSASLQRLSSGFKINGAKHGTEDNCFVPDRKLREDRQSEICPILVFAGAAYDNIVIAVSPVSRRTFRKALDALREKIKHTVVAAPYHFPAISTPFICVLQQVIRGKASHDNRAWRDFQRSVPLLL